MDQALQHFIVTYGYWAMAFGAIIEGETFLVAGGIAAHHGLLSIPGLIALAVVGSVLHDHFFFLLGRYAGGWLKKRESKFHEKAEKVHRAVEKYGAWVIVGFRFAYGFRMLVPSLLGMGPTSLLKFFIFDVIGGVIWSAVFIIGGYYFGAGLDLFLQWIEPYVGWAMYTVIAVIILLAVVFIGLRVCRRVKKRPERRVKSKDDLI